MQIEDPRCKLGPMDAHYHIVMKAREAIKDTKPKLYFAYSTILDRGAFEEWRHEHSYQFFNLPQGKLAEAENTDLEFNFLSRWWGGRVAGLVEKPGSKVYGMLFEIPAKDWPVVQHKEGFITGMCIERPIKVKVGNEEIEATAFTTTPARATAQGPISADFIEALLRGAQASGLPGEYIEKLKGLK
jgi:gamma-glutamylcyclotransferase